MTSARIQQFFRKFNIEIVCFNGKETTPRKIPERNTSLFINNEYFCLNWNSQGKSFDKAIEDDLKLNFKVVNNVISDKHVKNFNKYEYKPKKVQSPLTNVIVYDLETFNKIRAVQSCSCINKLSKISSTYNGDISEKENRKCLNGCVVCKWTDCIKEMLDDVLSFKGEAKKTKSNLLNEVFIW